MIDQSKAWGALQNMSRNTDKYFDDRPDTGKRVIVEKGRKHKGKEGIVFWHGPDRYPEMASGVAAETRGAEIILIGIDIVATACKKQLPI